MFLSTKQVLLPKKFGLDTEMNRNKCNDVDENIIPYINNTAYVYGSQNDSTTFKETEIDYATDIHGNYMDAMVMAMVES